SSTLNFESIQWAGANNPLWILTNNEFKLIKPDKQPIGKSDNATAFHTHDVKIETGSMLYLFTDGYADQFGGSNGKKFKYANLQKLLIELSELEMEQQSELLNKRFEEWRSDLEQVDDVCIVGIRF